MTAGIDRVRMTRWTWSVAAILVLVLAILWLAGYGPVGAGACCGVAEASTDAAPTSAPAAVADVPTTQAPAAPSAEPTKLDTTAAQPATSAITEPVSNPEDVRCSARMPAAVTFATASSRIDTRGRKLLDAIVPCLKNDTYEIAGHTDSVGTEDENRRLATARAEAVRAYMILKGVDAERLVAMGYGADRPIGDNTTRDGRAKNRRIEFVRK